MAPSRERENKMAIELSIGHLSLETERHRGPYQRDCSADTSLPFIVEMVLSRHAGPLEWTYASDRMDRGLS